MSADTSSTKPVVLVDGSSYLFRAFHALPPLITSKGQPTGAIKGVINMLRALIKEYSDYSVAVIFDAKGKTFRNDLYPEYKANRPPMPNDLRSQIAPLHELIRDMGLPLIIVDGVEADDVIGTYAEQATAKGIKTVISTGDKDMAQLVNEHVTLINTMSNTAMDIAGVEEKFGIPPELIIDYLTLMGDKVDNIPGVEKCGPKTAVKWLKAYGTLDGVIENADKVGGKVGEYLREAIPNLPLSYELATIKCDVELELDITELESTAPNNEALFEHYELLEFKSWANNIGGSSTNKNASKSSATSSSGADTDSQAVRPPQPEINRDNYETIMNEADFARWMEKLQKAELIAFDTETTSLNYMRAEIVGLSFAVEAGEAMYIPVAHDYPGAPDQLDRDWVLKELKPLLESHDVKKVGQHLKYDKNVLANYDINLQGIAFDTMLESYVLNSVATRHDMNSLAQYYLDHSTIHFEDIAGKGKKQLTFNQIGLEEAAPYAAEDADITLRLHQTLWPQLQAIPSLAKVLIDIEMPLVPVLSEMEYCGAYVDVDMLRNQSQSLAKRMLEIEQEAYDIAGQTFNLSSPKQLGEILYEKLAIPIIKKTPKGAPSTAEAVLQELALDYPLPKVLMEYRGLSKLKSTYTDRLPEQVHSRSKRVHTSYHQAVAATGRLSSSDPNLQNIPIKSAEGRRIRQAFNTKPGYKIVAADYSQIELRIMAHLSKDKTLQTAFANNQDIHRATAAEVFSVAAEDVSDTQRRHAKAINFGLIYGMSAFGLAKQLNIGRKEAQEYIDTYFERYPGVLQYMEDTREQAAENGYVETIYGRRLYLPEINSSNGMRRQGAQRTAINAPMQGTAADIIKKAMLSVRDLLKESDCDTKMIMQVHDELVFEIAEDKLDETIAAIKNAMETAATLDVPLIVDVGTGENWDEAH